MAEIRNPPRQDSFLCRLGFHAPQKGALWNEGYYFTRCDRCGSDLIRTTYSGWEVPRGYRIVWKQRPIEPNGEAPALREPARIQSSPMAPARQPAAPASHEAPPAQVVAPALAQDNPSLDTMIERAVAALKGNVSKSAQPFEASPPPPFPPPAPSRSPVPAPEPEADPEPVAPRRAESSASAEPPAIILPAPAAPPEDVAPASQTRAEQVEPVEAASPAVAPEPAGEASTEEARPLEAAPHEIFAHPVSAVPPAAGFEAEAPAPAPPPAPARSAIPDFMDEPLQTPQPAAIEGVSRARAAPPF